MQVSATILDYQFGKVIETAIPNTDLRTEFIGRFFGLVNMINVFLQFIGSFILVKVMGLKNCHFFVPIILLTNAVSVLIHGNFSAIAIAFGSVKCLDYSLWGIIKEMLYVPLKVDEKFKAKAIIDIFAYRTSKACASLSIFFIQIFFSLSLTILLSWTIIAISLVWVAAIFFLFKYYYRAVEKKEALTV